MENGIAMITRSTTFDVAERQRRRDRLREPLIAAGDVIPLVGRSEDLEVARV